MVVLISNHQDDIVKLQILNLATKLCITNSKQTRLLCQYVFNLAKYDLNYDIRDRARFLRQLILPAVSGDKNAVSVALAKHAKKIFLAPKPAPVLESKFKGKFFSFHPSIEKFFLILCPTVHLYCRNYIIPNIC